MIADGVPGPRVVAVSVGRPQERSWRDRRVRSAIWKAPVVGPVAVRRMNLAGDAQADRTAHGGPDKAVYAYASEDEAWWGEQLGLELGPGSMGENLTTAGLDLTAAVVGDQWQVGTVRLQVTQPRIPCYKLGIRVGDERFPARFAAAHRHGVYLRVLEEGTLEAGEAVQLVDRPAHGFLAVEVACISSGQRHRAAELLELPELASSWHAWARRQLVARDGEADASA